MSQLERAEYPCRVRTQEVRPSTTQGSECDEFERWVRNLDVILPVVFRIHTMNSWHYVQVLEVPHFINIHLIAFWGSFKHL